MLCFLFHSRGVLTVFPHDLGRGRTLHVNDEPSDD